MDVTAAPAAWGQLRHDARHAATAEAAANRWRGRAANTPSCPKPPACHCRCGYM